MHASIINIAIYYKIRLKIYIKLLFNDVYVILDVFLMGEINLFLFSDRASFAWRTQENLMLSQQDILLCKIYEFLDDYVVRRTSVWFNFSRKMVNCNKYNVYKAYKPGVPNLYLF